VVGTGAVGRRGGSEIAILRLMLLSRLLPRAALAIACVASAVFAELSPSLPPLPPGIELMIHGAGSGDGVGDGDAAPAAMNGGEEHGNVRRLERMVRQQREEIQRLKRKGKRAEEELVKEQSSEDRHEKTSNDFEDPFWSLTRHKEYYPMSHIPAVAAARSSMDTEHDSQSRDDQETEEGERQEADEEEGDVEEGDPSEDSADLDLSSDELPSHLFARARGSGRRSRGTRSRSRQHRGKALKRSRSKRSRARTAAEDEAKDDAPSMEDFPDDIEVSVRKAPKSHVSKEAKWVRAADSVEAIEAADAALHSEKVDEKDQQQMDEEAELDMQDQERMEETLDSFSPQRRGNPWMLSKGGHKKSALLHLSSAVAENAGTRVQDIVRRATKVLGQLLLRNNAAATGE